jgi:hypothetical protein
MTVDVGFPEATAALVCGAFTLEFIGSQVKVLPSKIVATKVCPKLSNDQSAEGKTTVLAEDACPQPTKFVVSSTIDPFECADLVDPLAPLVIPVKSLDDFPVYVINSPPTKIVPVVGNKDASAKVMFVAEPLFPCVSSAKEPFKVEDIAPAILPLHKPVPHPKPKVWFKAPGLT